MTPTVAARAIAPGRVEVTLTLDAIDAQDFALGVVQPAVDEDEILDAVEAANEWENRERGAQ